MVRDEDERYSTPSDNRDRADLSLLWRPADAGTGTDVHTNAYAHPGTDHRLQPHPAPTHRHVDTRADDHAAPSDGHVDAPPSHPDGYSAPSNSHATARRRAYPLPIRRHRDHS